MEDNKNNFGSGNSGSTMGSGSGSAAGTSGNNTYQSGSTLGSTGSGTSGFGTGVGSTPSGTSGTSGVTNESTGLMPVEGIGLTSASEGGLGIISLLERFGVDEAQINAVRDTLKNMNLDQSLDKAKESVTESMNKAREYARQNPGAVLAGVAVLVIGAGLIAGAAMKRKD